MGCHLHGINFDVACERRHPLACRALHGKANVFQGTARWLEIESVVSKLQLQQRHDRVLVRQLDQPDATPHLTKPLRRDVKTVLHRGAFEHNEIIGKSPRDVIRTSSGRELLLQIPTLAEYVTLTGRMVTPIYPGAANLITSRLDIHVTQPSPPESEADSKEAPLELLEIGTGHGSLTLHLARTIHAANTPAPSASIEEGDTEASQTQRLAIWRAQRNAILHTLDKSAQYSAHAERIVSGFRRGIYAGNVDFHVGEIQDWLADQYAARGGSESAPVQFLRYVVADVPRPTDLLVPLAGAMPPDGTLAIFTPHITSIVQCVEEIKRKRLPWFLENTIELGSNNSAGKLWEVRPVKPRTGKPRSERGQSSSSDMADEVSSDELASEDELDDNRLTNEKSLPAVDSTRDNGNWQMICRPKMGDLIVQVAFWECGRR